MTIIYLTMQFEPDLSDAGAPDAPNFLKHRPLGIRDVTIIENGVFYVTAAGITRQPRICEHTTPRPPHALARMARGRARRARSVPEVIGGRRLRPQTDNVGQPGERSKVPIAGRNAPFARER